MKKLFLLFLPIFLFARVVDFQEALDLTLENNKELKAKEFDLKKAEEDLKEAKAYKDGTIDFSHNASITNNAGYVFGMKMASREASFADFGFDEFLSSTAMMKMMMNQTNITSSDQSSLLSTQPDKLNNPASRMNFESKVTYQVPLYTGEKLENAAKMAKLQQKAKSFKLLHDKKQIGLEVVKAYNGAVTAKKFIVMTKNAKQIANRFVNKSKNLIDNHLARGIDLKQSKMAAYSVDAKIQEAQNQFDLAIAYLQFLTSDKTISDVNGFVQFDIKNSSIKNLQKKALQIRDDYKWMELNTNTLRTKIDFDSSGEKPTIGAHLEYGMNDDSLNPLKLDEKDYYLAAIGLQYNLFDGGINNIKKQKAKIDYFKTRKYFEHMKDGITLEVKKNYLDYKTMKSILKQKIQTKKMAEDILKETEDIYSNNLRFRTNMMYLLMQFENMIKAQADVILSEYEKTITSAKLQLSVGKSLKE